MRVQRHHMSTVDMPGWVIFIDECATLGGLPEQAELWTRLVTTVRTPGVAINAGSVGTVTVYDKPVTGHGDVHIG